MKNSVFIISTLIIGMLNPCLAQLPTDSLALWLRADAGIYSDIFCTTPAASSSDQAFCWEDQSPNVLNVIRQESATPVYQQGVLNGLPVVRFDGTGGLGSLLSQELDFTEMTIFVVASTPDQLEAYVNISSTEAPLERFFVGKWSNDGNENSTSPSISYNRPTSSNFWRAFDHQTDVSGFPYLLVSAAFHEAGDNLNMNVLGIPSTESAYCSKIGLGRFCPGTATRHERAIYIGQREDAASYPLTGDIAEVIVYGGIALDQARRTLVENYLSAKYGLTIHPPADFYAGDLDANGNYDIDVSGIGAEEDSSAAAGYSAGLFIEESNRSLEPGDYLLAGHRTPNGDMSVAGLPSGIVQRTRRIWYIDKSGELDARVSFDFSMGPALPAGNAYALLYTSVDGADFNITTATPFIDSSRVSFELNNTELIDGYYTLGTGDPIASPLPELIGSSVPILTSTDLSGIKPSLELSAIYPNPFNPEATFEVTPTRSEHVRIVMVDLLGREVRVIHDNLLSPQPHRFTIQSDDLPSGVYLLHVSGSNYVLTRKAVLIK